MPDSAAVGAHPFRAMILARFLRRRDMNAGLRSMTILRTRCWRAKSVICCRLLYGRFAQISSRLGLRHGTMAGKADGARLRVGVGIDCSSAMLRVAGRENVQSADGSRERDCENLPFPGEVFDLAICSFAVGHIADLESVVRELATRDESRSRCLRERSSSRGLRARLASRVSRRDGTAVQIETSSPYSRGNRARFCANGFECQTHEPLYLGEPERPLFVRAGKSHSFIDACKLPAVLVCHFRRIDRPTEAGPEDFPASTPTAFAATLGEGTEVKHSTVETVVAFLNFSRDLSALAAQSGSSPRKQWKHALQWLEDAGLIFYFLQKLKDNTRSKLSRL